MDFIKTNSAKAWFLAARPKTLAAAAMPVWVGCAFAASDGVFSAAPAALCLLFALIMQINANFINDLFDWKKGSDGKGRLGPKRACAEGWITPHAMAVGISTATSAAALVGMFILFYGGIAMLFVGVACMAFAFLYTAGPYPLAYKGFGDILVVVFFGLVPVCCTFYLMSGYLNLEVFAAALACGLVSDTLLVVNNYRDIAQDAANGKRTLIVRYGVKFGGNFYFALGLSAVLLCLVFDFQRHPFAALLPLFYLYLHFRTWRKMLAIKTGEKLNSLLGETSRNMLAFGFLLGAGLLV